MPNNIWAIYYPKNNERLKKAREIYQNISKEEKEKRSENMVANVTKISEKLKKLKWLSIEKK